MRIVSIGEILWDVIGPSEYLGGAPLNFAAHAHKLGHEVFLVSAVGDDERGRRALDGLEKCGDFHEFVQVIPGKRTGTAEVELDADGKPMFRIMRPAAYDFVDLNAAEVERLAALTTGVDLLRNPVSQLAPCPERDPPAARTLCRRKKFFDVNLRDGNWNLPTVEQLGFAGQRDQAERQRSRVPRRLAGLARDLKHRLNISAGDGAINTAARPSA